MIKGFRDFIMRGNVIDLAVAVVVGAAFTALVAALTDGIIQPIIARILGSQDTGGVTDILGIQFQFAAVINAVITFLITAAVVYFVFVAPMNAWRDRRAQGAEPEPEAVSEDVLILREIRDLLKSADGPGAPPHSASGTSPEA